MTRKWYDITTAQLERIENRLRRVMLNKKKQENGDDVWVLSFQRGHNGRTDIETTAKSWERSLLFANRIESFLRANGIKYRREDRCFDIRNWEVKKILSAELCSGSVRIKKDGRIVVCKALSGWL